MIGITENIMPPCVQNVCDYAKKVAGTLRKASILSGIFLGAFSITMCGATEDDYHDMERSMGLYMAKLLLLANILLVFGILTEKADFLWATLSINAVLIPATPIWIIFSLMNRRPYIPLGATAGPCGLVAVFLQSAIVYGCLLEMKGISNAAEKSSSHVGSFNTVAGHKEMCKEESNTLPAIFSLGKDAKQADSLGV